MKNYVSSLLLILLFAGVLKAQDNPVEVIGVRDPNGTKNIEFFAINDNVGKFIVRVTFPRIVNLRSTTGVNNFVGTVGPGKTKLFTLRPLILKSPVDYSLVFSSHRGCERVRLKDDITYLFPFKSKEERYVYDNEHFKKLEKITDDSNKAAYGQSIMLQKEEVVYATRRGLVIDVRENIDDDNYSDIDEQDKGNYLTIQHDDCSFSRYESLRKESIIPAVGDKVDAGQIIANVGGKKYEKGYRLKYYYYSISYDRNNDKALVNYLNPDFLIEGKRQKASSGGLYKSNHSIELVIQDMSKREKKKYRN